MDEDVPKHILYWLTTTSKHDCFFNVGPESGSKERIGAVRILLFGHSEVLREMLEKSPLAEKGDVLVTDSDPETFKNFLKCIYGATEIVIRKLSLEESLNVMYLCEKYLACELKENIAMNILRKYKPLSADKALKILLNPVCFTSETLTKAISTAIQNHTDEILNDKSFSDLDFKSVEYIVKQDKITSKEVNLWIAVLNWANQKVDSKDSKELRSFLGNILKYVRFCAMEANEFCRSVIPSNLLTDEEILNICKSIGTANPPNLGDALCCVMSCRTIVHETKKVTHVIEKLQNISGSRIILEVKVSKINLILEISRVEFYRSYGIDIHLIWSHADSENKLPWSCLVNIELSLKNCKFCDSKIIKTKCMLISNNTRSRIEPELWRFTSEQLSAFVTNNSLQLHFYLKAEFEGG